MRTYSTLKELEENSTELPESIANHPMLTPMSKLVKESPVDDKRAHDAGHRDEKLLKKHHEEGGKSSVEKDAYPQDSSVPPEAKDLKSVDIKKKTIRADERTMDKKEAQERATVNYEELQLENYRVLARKGMGTETKKECKKGRGIDFYEPTKGDKRTGIITKVGPKGYEVQDEKDRKKYNFTFFDPKNYKKLMQQEVEMTEAKETGGWYVKYATSKKGPISQVYFSDKTQAEGFLQKINKMGARGILSDKETKGAIPMGHRSVRRQEELEAVEEVFNVGKMSDKELKGFINGFDMDSKMGAAAAMQRKAAKKEAMKRNLKLEEPELDEAVWDSVDWSALADLARSNPKKFKKKTDWIEWVNKNIKPDNPAASQKALKAWESMDLSQIMDFIEEQCKCQELSVRVDGRTRAFRETRSRIESRLARLKEKLRQATKEQFAK